MAVSLSKGGNVSLSKEDPSLKNVLVGLGWDSRMTDGKEFDLDASVFLLQSNGRVARDSDFIFYNNLSSMCGAVLHKGDNRTGNGDGDDEEILVDLSKISASTDRVVFVVTIHDGLERRQSFGQVSNAYIRILNNESNSEIARFDLQEDSSTETAMIFGELYRQGSEWRFRAVAQGISGGLATVCANYGITIS